MPCRAAVPYHLDISKEGMSHSDTSHLTLYSHRLSSTIVWRS
jgi:hypothetical protein